MIEALIFATYVYFLPNPHDDGEAYRVPFSYSVPIYLETQNYFGQDAPLPEELVAVLVAEHGGQHPYPYESEGAAGELGLFQIQRHEVKEANIHLGTDYKLADMNDPAAAIRVAVFTVYDDKHTHRTARRCVKRVKHSELITDETGALTVRSELRKQKHTWHAHYRCAPKIRELYDQRGKQICKTRWRERLVKRFARWRELGLVRWLQASPKTQGTAWTLEPKPSTS
jgi:hypothetical protein